MSGFFGIGVSGLQAFQRALSTASHNIANVNTEGYSRQRVELENAPGNYTPGGFLGAGVRTRATERVFNQFLQNEVRSSQSVAAQLNVFYEFSAQIDNRLADPATGLSPGIQDLFSAVQSLADDPASVPVRQLLLSQSDVLADRFRALDGSLRDLETRINGQARATVTEINTLAKSLADLNLGIQNAIAKGGNQSPNDLLDQRDQVINDLARKVSVTTLEQDNAISVFIGNGQALVLGGDVVPLATVAGSFDSSRLEVNAGGATVTNNLVGGEIGGLFEFRRNVLDEAFNALGRMAAGISADFNAQNAQGLDLDGNLGSAFFVGVSPRSLAHSGNTGLGTVSASLSDTSALTTSDYELRFDGGSAYTLTRLKDGQTFAVDTTVPASLTVDGFDLSIGAGAAVGDRFLVQPTHDGASQFDRAITDVRHIAAAGALRASVATDVNGLPTNGGTGEITQPSVSTAAGLPLAGPVTLTFDPNALGAGVPGFTVAGGPAGPIAYDPSTESGGKTFTFTGFGDLAITVSGTPLTGDSFRIDNNSGGTSDNRNILAMGELQRSNRLVTGSANYQAAYGQLISLVGSQTRQAEVNSNAQEGLLNRAQESLEGVRGVNLDEEAANLVRFQQAYQASAQVVSVADTVFQSLLSAVG